MSIGIVQTKYGKVRGVDSSEAKYTGISYFKSIPYAAPPVGKLRWQPPQNPASWEGVRECDTFESRPMQVQVSEIVSFEPWASDFYYGGYPEMNEDCLYLSVATGASAAGEKRPVFMWFHGGGLSNGFYHEIEFDPYELAKKGIIVVSVGQRLNVFGYLTLPQISVEQDGKSGNYGLMDEVKALEWVYENIAAFGGDPENITIGGQSGGTAKSGSLACSPAAKGRVRRVINQSWLNWSVKFPTIADAEQNGLKYLDRIGLDRNITLEELRNIDAKRFYNIVNDDGVGRMGAIPGSMVCDGYYVAEQDQTISFAKYAGNLDYISGSNYGETTMHAGMLLGGDAFTTAAAVYSRVKDMVGEELYNKYDFENLVKITDENADHMSRWLAALGLSWRGSMMVNRYFGEYRASKFPDARTWSYIFSQIPPSLPEETGTYRDQNNLLAWHSADLWFTFASLREGVPPVRKWSADDFKAADIISSYWANFMKTGDPNGDGLPEWPESDANLGWIELKTEPVAHKGLEDNLDKFIREYMENNIDLPTK